MAFVCGCCKRHFFLQWQLQMWPQLSLHYNEGQWLVLIKRLLLAAKGYWINKIPKTPFATCQYISPFACVHLWCVIPWQPDIWRPPSSLQRRRWLRWRRPGWTSNQLLVCRLLFPACHRLNKIERVRNDSRCESLRMGGVKSMKLKLKLELLQLIVSICHGERNFSHTI